MPIKVDGTNGILQAYDFQTPTTGFSYTFTSGIQALILAPSGTLASGSITMPAAPSDGMVIKVESSQLITALSINGNAGQSIIGGTAQLLPNQPLGFIYRSANTTWYPFTGGAGRATAVCSGTSVASTSGTSIDFTGIPSWVKRITVMFQNVSTNGTSIVQVQVGAGSVTTTGYVVANQAGTSTSNPTTGFPTYGAAASDARSGTLTFTNITGNTWVGSGVSGNTGGSGVSIQGGYIALSGTLDRIRITTVNGTDTFDAGLINILYE